MNANAAGSPISMLAIPFPASGPVDIRRELVKENFGTKTIILQHGGQFRMAVDDGENGFKVTLKPQDALWIIDELALGAKCIEPFRRCVTWANNADEVAPASGVTSGGGLGYVVELEEGVWLCEEIEGDPGRTLVLESASRYKTLRLAEDAMNRAKKFRVFPNHNIRPIFAKPNNRHEVCE